MNNTDVVAINKLVEITNCTRLKIPISKFYSIEKPGLEGNYNYPATKLTEYYTIIAENTNSPNPIQFYYIKSVPCSLSIDRIKGIRKPYTPPGCAEYISYSGSSLNNDLGFRPTLRSHTKCDCPILNCRLREL